jgi:hypothetical protein
MSIEDELAELRATVGYLKDRQDILDCIQRESRARDRQNVNQIAGCWWEDGVDEHGAVVTFAPDYPEKANLGHAMNFNLTSHNRRRCRQLRILCDRRPLLARRQEHDDRHRPLPRPP